MGIHDVTVHGFRSAFRDWCGEETHFPREIAEAALARVIGHRTCRAMIVRGKSSTYKPQRLTGRRNKIFHFASIEQGGTSLYPTLALRVTNPTVLRILLSIGPTETMHFQTWQDKAVRQVRGQLGFCRLRCALISSKQVKYTFRPSRRRCRQ